MDMLSCFWHGLFGNSGDQAHQQDLFIPTTGTSQHVPQSAAAQNTRQPNEPVFHHVPYVPYVPSFVFHGAPFDLSQYLSHFFPSDAQRPLLFAAPPWHAGGAEDIQEPKWRNLKWTGQGSHSGHGHAETLHEVKDQLLLIRLWTGGAVGYRMLACTGVVRRVHVGIPHIIPVLFATCTTCQCKASV